MSNWRSYPLNNKITKDGIPFFLKARPWMIRCQVAAVKVNTFKDEQVWSNNIYVTPALCEYTCTVLMLLARLNCVCFGSGVHCNCCQLEMLFLLAEDKH